MPGRDETSVAWRSAVAVAAAASIALVASVPVSAVSEAGGGGPEPSSLGTRDGRFFGFNLGPIARRSARLGPREYAYQAKAAGANMVRVSLEWQRVERRRDRWNERRWGEFEAVHDAMVTRRVTPLFTFGYAPRWARDRDSRGRLLCTGKCPPAAARTVLREWREFVAEAARRLPRAAFGVWNEPNLAAGWSTGHRRVNPVRFARLAAHTHRAVNRVSPSRPVVSGSLATRAVRRRSADMAAREFLRRAYAAGLKGSADAIGLNVYPSSRDRGPRSRYVRVLLGVRQVKVLAGDQATELWVTELGRTTSGPRGATQDGQARVLVRSLGRMTTMPDVGAVLIHRLDDNAKYRRRHPEYGFGVLREGRHTPLRPKQAYCDLAARVGTDYPLCWAQTRIESEPRPVHGDTRIRFRFSASESGARFECSLNRARLAPCTSPISYAGLGDGRHRFRVRSLDADGNRDPTPARSSFRVDTSSPETLIVLRPVLGTTDRTPSFTFVSPSLDVDRFRCRVDRRRWRRCSSPYTAPRLGPGSHRFSARAVDRAGNVDRSPARSTFAVYGG